MRLVDIHRARYDGWPREALAAAKARLVELDLESRASPRWQEMWCQLMCLSGDCHLDLSEYEAAEAYFDEVYRRTGDGVALANRAYARLRQGMLAPAKQDYLAAIKLPGDPEDLDVEYRNLVEVCLAMGDVCEARVYLSKARDLVGDTWEVELTQREIERHQRLGRE